MARSIENEFYRSTAWEKTRVSFMQYKNGLCERCMKQGRYVPAEIVHHIIHLNPSNVHDPDIAFGFDNLEAVCRTCHNQIHYGSKVESRYKIGTDGRLIIGNDSEDSDCNTNT